MIPVLLACAQPSDDVARYGAALKDGRCEEVGDAALRDDCWLAAGACERVADATLRAECAFQAAEKSGDAARCAEAGPFVDDCRLHLFSSGLAKWVPKDRAPGEGEDEAAAHVVAVGLAADDPRPWSAYYRWVLGQRSPLDRAACARIEDAGHREACERTGLALYADRLNHARDRHTYPCDGGPLPRDLQYAPDPELDALIASRKDLCSSR